MKKPWARSGRFSFSQHKLLRRVRARARNVYATQCVPLHPPRNLTHLCCQGPAPVQARCVTDQHPHCVPAQPRAGPLDSRFCFVPGQRWLASKIIMSPVTLPKWARPSYNHITTTSMRTISQFYASRECSRTCVSVLEPVVAPVVEWVAVDAAGRAFLFTLSSTQAHDAICYQWGLAGVLGTPCSVTHNSTRSMKNRICKPRTAAATINNNYISHHLPDMKIMHAYKDALQSDSMHSQSYRWIPATIALIACRWWGGAGPRFMPLPRVPTHHPFLGVN